MRDSRRLLQAKQKGDAESLGGEMERDEEVGSEPLKMPSDFPRQPGAASSDIPLTPQNLQFLQRSVGNQAVGQLLQTRLRGNQPDGQSADGESSSDEGQLREDGYAPPAPAENQAGASPILRKEAEGSGGRKSHAPIMRQARDIPGGAILRNPEVDFDLLLMFMQYAAISASASFGENADFRGNVGPLLSEAIASKLAPRTIQFDFVETRGVNVRWRGHVRFKIGPAIRLPGSTTATTTRNFGGTGTVSTQVTNSTTDSGKLTGGVKAGDAKAGGEASVSAEGGTSSTRSSQTGTSVTSNQGGSVTTNEQLDSFIAPLYAQIYLDAEFDASGTDYVNPVKWIMFLGETASRVTREYAVGTVTFDLPQGVPVQRKGWMEHESGVGEAAAAHAPDAGQFSRAGARPLPQPLARAAEEHHGVALGGVNLIQGGQADAYCDEMDAAAFTTPNAEGGSDIFLHSDASADSATGQHTLQHEIAHAVQHMKGQTAALEGLGGSEARRDELEHSADQQADAILSKKK